MQTEVRKRSKPTKGKDDQDKFNEILDRCLVLLFSRMENGGDIFDLLDPLISDTQCHIHSIVILNILSKCYNDNGFNNQRIRSLQQDDRRILAYAVLFSLLKIDYRDTFGFMVYQVSIRHFEGLLLSSKKREYFSLTQARKNFNFNSVDYMRSIASQEIGEVLKECHAIASNFQLKLLPCYASTKVIIDYMMVRKWPIIISLKCLSRRSMGDDGEYEIARSHLRFYEYQDEEDKFVHKKLPTDHDKTLPTITFRCFSLANNGIQEFPTDCNIRDLIMLCAASHTQLLNNAVIPAGHENQEEYVRNLFDKNNDLYESYKNHYVLANKLNLIGARYSSRVVLSSMERTFDENAFTIERRRENAVFVVDHVCVSNYSREFRFSKSFDFPGSVDQTEVFNFDKKKRTLWKL